MFDSDKEVIKIPGPEELLVQSFKHFRLTQQEAARLKKDPYIRQVIEYFRGKPITRGRPLSEIYDRFLEFETPDHKYLKEPLKLLIDLHGDQYLAARDVLDKVIGLHDSSKEPYCVYWGGHLDEFAARLGKGWWRYVGSYSGEKPDFVPEDWSVSHNPVNVWIKTKPSVVNYDVTSESLHPLIPEDSVDVSLFKTIGSGYMQHGPTLKGFWDKITQTTKLGGLVITTDDIPPEYCSSFIPYERMIDTIGTSHIQLNAPVAYQTLMHGYTSPIFSCYTLQSK